MRKIFTNHHVYTFGIGLLAFVWVFSQQPYEFPATPQTAGTKGKTNLAARQPVQPVKPVEPVSIGTIITKQGLEAQPIAPSLSGEAGEITASISRLPSPGVSGGNGTFLRVVADKLRMRSAPSSSSQTLATYPLGTEVEQLTRSGKWLEVRNLSDGTTGWMHADYLAQSE